MLIMVATNQRFSVGLPTRQPRTSKHGSRRSTSNWWWRKSGDIVGVGAASAAGEILLNYVSPDARFRGVSKAILLHLESYVLAQGNRKSFLSSTRTAHPFYLAVGYEDAGEPELWAGMSAQPMVKWLSPERGVQ